MTKQEEIDILQSLKGDTYFGQLFGPDQIDAMCENVRRDFAIESGVDLFEGSQVARENARLKERNKALRKG